MQELTIDQAMAQRFGNSNKEITLEQQNKVPKNDTMRLVVMVSFIVCLLAAIYTAQKVYTENERKRGGQELLDLRHVVGQCQRSVRTLPHGHIRIQN